MLRDDRTTTPKQAGYRMPAEWAAHERCWMMWPCRPEMWPDMDATRSEYAAVAHAIARFEPVVMAVCPEDEAQARRMLASEVQLAVTPMDDSWARDAGPCFVVDGEGRRAGVNFRFNAWGGKYRPYDRDDAFSSFVLSHADVPQFHSTLVAEGGGISVDGEGTILTTVSCFPNPNRNPGWSHAAIEHELMEMLGGSKVIWLPGNVHETETDGHVDGIGVFVKPGLVLMENPGQRGDPDHDAMTENLRALRGRTDATGHSIEVVTIPQALAVTSDSERFCRSYVNAYIANGGVVIPAYGIADDDVVYQTFCALFPQRQVVQVPIANIAVGGGGIHCITQQEPAAPA